MRADLQLMAGPGAIIGERKKRRFSVRQVEIEGFGIDADVPIQPAVSSSDQYQPPAAQESRKSALLLRQAQQRRPK